ncbi:hypothetical protein HDC90_004525 [Pedobacter sp. AK013]|uniref:tail fiber protein n=1 Tax=Pedobacter sp. AK013 TaxID=2723071 RepID=UPI00161CC087|nr:tail fiber protein [Pedobacter sp. AK013]MBB6239863.1 hypothetical protein [Pedobacter sp. AK013]
MKKILLVSILIGSVLNQVKAQLGNVKGNAFEISSSGGTTTNNVMHKTWLLRNNDGDSWYTASVHDGIAVDVSFWNPQVDTRTWWERNPYSGTQMWGDASQTYMVLSGGNLGLGTLTPTSKLEVQTSGNGWPLSLRANAFSPGDINGIKFYSGYIGEDKWAGIASVAEDLHSNKTALSFYSGQTEKIRLAWNGNVGIGTSNPQDKLTVAGNIGAREIKVSINAGADFVFEADYKLPDLAELEKFVKTNKHLPDIQTAKQMIENGINLGELNIKLLQKVEELTLHLIEKDKNITQLTEQLKLQAEMLKAFAKQLKTIEESKNKLKD